MSATETYQHKYHFAKENRGTINDGTKNTTTNTNTGINVLGGNSNSGFGTSERIMEKALENAAMNKQDLESKQQQQQQQHNENEGKQDSKQEEKEQKQQITTISGFDRAEKEFEELKGNIDDQPIYVKHFNILGVDGMFIVFGGQFGYVTNEKADKCNKVPLNAGFATCITLGLGTHFKLSFKILGKLTQGATADQVKKDFDLVFADSGPFDDIAKNGYYNSVNSDQPLNFEEMSQKFLYDNSSSGKFLFESRFKTGKAFFEIYKRPNQQHQDVTMGI